MRSILIPALLLLSTAAAQCDPAGDPTGDPAGVTVAPKSPDATETREFRTAGGRLLGTVTVIAGVKYFSAADGTPLGTAEVVDGRRIYRSF